MKNFKEGKWDITSVCTVLIETEKESEYDTFAMIINNPEKDTCEMAEKGELPSAQPEQRWIPVTERLPKYDDWQLVTILDESGDTPYRYSDFGWYLEAAKCWVVEAAQRTDIVAWMPLPKPWKGEV